MPQHRSDRRLNDERILQAASKVLGTDRSASMQQIADAAGVDRRTVYRRYPSREALAAAMKEAVGREVTRRLDAFPGWSGSDSLVTLVSGLVTSALRYPLALASHDPMAEDSPIDRRIEAILAAGQDAGYLRAGPTPVMLNAILLATIVAGVRVHPEAEPAVLAEEVVMLLRDGIGVRTP